MGIPSTHIKVGQGDTQVCNPSALEMEMDEQILELTGQPVQPVSESQLQ